MYIINIHIHCHVHYFYNSRSLRSPKITNTFIPHVIAVERRRARARSPRAPRRHSRSPTSHSRERVGQCPPGCKNLDAFLSASVIPAVAYTTAHPTTAMPEKKGHARGTSRTSAVKKLWFEYGMSEASARTRVRTKARPRSRDARGWSGSMVGRDWSNCDFHVDIRQSRARGDSRRRRASWRARTTGGTIIS